MIVLSHDFVDRVLGISASLAFKLARLVDVPHIQKVLRFSDDPLYDLGLDGWLCDKLSLAGEPHTESFFGTGTLYVLCQEHSVRKFRLSLG